MRFPYQRLLVKDNHQKVHVIHRPLVPVHVVTATKSLLTYGLVDSGADVCLFDSAFCDKLGFNLASGRKHVLRGVGKDKIFFYLHRITIQIGMWSASIEAGFSSDISHIPFSILGHKGFFDHFLVAFNYPKRWMEIIRAK